MTLDLFLTPLSLSHMSFSIDQQILLILFSVYPESHRFSHLHLDQAPSSLTGPWAPSHPLQAILHMAATGSLFVPSLDPVLPLLKIHSGSSHT